MKVVQDCKTGTQAYACKCTTPEVCLLGSGAVSNPAVKKFCTDEE